MRIVTAGPKYLDIDSYAGIIGYAELLRNNGAKAQAVSTAPLNGSITETIRAWEVELARVYQPNESDTFTLIDVSEPAFFEPFVDLDRVDEVIDHHTGYEDFWRGKIGEKARIEFLGAACTQVFERWDESKALNHMSPTTARLLASGILDNTLNFLAEATTERDRKAYKSLARVGGLSQDWPRQYFMECQVANLSNLAETVRSDTKVKTVPGYSGELLVGQMALWEAMPAIDRVDEIKRVLGDESGHWFMNLISISEGRSYLIAQDADIQDWVKKTLDVAFDGIVAVADRLWLRKEIFKTAQERYE